ncbi:aldose 1-epimerase [Terrarubrum flagellatum]|uniref:aldose 1-epimerase n=1 Tax=Terrirubrum flagellatum TaxID=2895980 RepID=UPI0031455E12
MTVLAAQAARHSASPEPLQKDGLPLLAAGNLRAVVAADSGGRIAEFWRESRDGRRDVIVPMPPGHFDADAWPKAGIYPLIPWSNRIRNARFSFGDREATLRPHPACAPHALHGFGHAHRWQITQRSAISLTMGLRHDPSENKEAGWPWAFEARQTVTLDLVGLAIEIDIRNMSAEPMPVGFGSHPFFVARAGDVVEFSAEAEWAVDETGCATTRRELGAARQRIVAGSSETRHFSAWSGIATLRRQSGERVIVQASSPLNHLVAHAPSGADYVCVEPVSHVVDAFNLDAAGAPDTGAFALAPGESRAAVVRISLE